MEPCDICSLPKEVRDQLATIDKSRCFILVILGAIILNYYTVGIQRQQLICSATDSRLCKCLPPTLPFQALSSIMIIVSLLFFFGLSGQNAKNCGSNKKVCCQTGLNHLSSILVLVAALVRFGILVNGDTKLDD